MGSKECHIALSFSRIATETGQLIGRETLKTCASCCFTSFCSACPQSHDSSECSKFHELEKDEKFILQHFRKTRQTNLIFCTEKPRTEYVPLSTAENWYEYYTEISDKGMISDMITVDWKPKMTFQGQSRWLG